MKLTQEQYEEHQRRHGFAPEPVKAAPIAPAKQYDHPPRPAIPDPKPTKQTRALEADREGEAQGSILPHVRFTLRRVRLLDVDAKWGSVKDLLDGLAFARLIRGDREDEITLEVRQEKVGSFKEEETIIEITVASEAK